MRGRINFLARIRNFQPSSCSFRAKLPIIVSEAATGIWNDQIYVFGGFNHSRHNDFGRDEILIYDIMEDTWDEGPKLLKSRRMHKTIQFENELLKRF